MTALVLIDVQNDFLPGGALAVPNGDAIIPIINGLADHFTLTIASKDWHPEAHMSFAVNHPGKKEGDVIEWREKSQILWPVHCVQDTSGAEFPSSLNTERISKVIYKGTNPKVDSYSCFFDNERGQATACEEYLREQGIKELFFTGLATDYCVKFSVLDALRLGFRTHVIIDACRGVNLLAGDVTQAIEEMKEAGAQICESSAITGT